MAETRHVFLDGNQLPERFAALPEGGRLVIGETGFGTGLNFLCAWQLFREQAPASARLHFVSVEKFPLAHADLARALALWPSLTPSAMNCCSGTAPSTPASSACCWTAAAWC